MTALEQARATLQHLVRTSANLMVPERRALHLAQLLQRRIDRTLELHAPTHSGNCVECNHSYPCPTVVRLGVDQ